MTEVCSTPTVDTPERPERPEVNVRDFSMTSRYGETLYWAADRNWDDFGSHAHASIRVRLDVDGEPSTEVDADLNRSGDIEVIDRAIDALQKIRATLLTMYPPGVRPVGQCMEGGNWGRCRANSGHDGEHSFPTEAEWRELEAMREARRTRKAS